MAVPAFAKTFGKIKVVDATEAEEKNIDIYVVGSDWTTENVEMHKDGNGFSLVKGGRIYLATEPMDSFEGQ
jgi:hypothetical protein